MTLDARESINKVLSIGRLSLRYLQLVSHRFVHDGCQHSAAALTYMTLFAVVPMMTVTFSMFSLVPAFQDVGAQVQELIFNNFLPNSGTEVKSYLSDFSSQARTLSGLGVGILLITSYLMLHSIEKVFNRIWSTSGPRKGVSAFLLYWALLSLGPLLLGSAMLMNTYVLSVKLITDEITRSGLDILFSYLPWLLTASAFSLLYTVVPNCKVMLRYAIIGGCVATVGIELAKAGFGYFVSNSSYTSIYGAFAALPIFLLWIYLCWMIILGGAEFVRASENFGAEIRGQWPLHTAAIVALWLFWRAHKTGQEVSEIDSRRIGLPSQRWSEVRDQLLQNQIISVTENKNYTLRKSLDELTVWEVYQIFPQSLKVPSMAPRDIDIESHEGLWWRNYKNLIEEHEIRSQTLMSMTLNELFSSKNQNHLPSVKSTNISHISS